MSSKLSPKRRRKYQEQVFLSLYAGSCMAVRGTDALMFHKARRFFGPAHDFVCRPWRPENKEVSLGRLVDKGLKRLEAKYDL